MLALVMVVISGFWWIPAITTTNKRSPQLTSDRHNQQAIATTNKRSP
jgi:hypothetical protein